MVKIQGIYGIRNKFNGRIYVGQVSKSKGLNRRFTEHKNSLQNNKHYNSHLQRAWNKYGKDNFEFSLLEEVINPRDLDKREQCWMNRFCDNYYNIQPTAGGSCLGKRHSNITRKKISKANAKRIWTEEARLNQSQSQKGRILSESTKQKMSDAHKGKKHSSQEKLKISLSNKGRKLSDETKLKLSLAHQGKKPTKESINKRKMTFLKKPPNNGWKGAKQRTCNSWQVSLWNNGHIYLGSFNNPVAAAKEYDKYVSKIYDKENCYLNFPIERFNGYTQQKGQDEKK